MSEKGIMYVGKGDNVCRKTGKYMSEKGIMYVGKGDNVCRKRG